jgi:superfamily II RNA helicase
VEQLRVEDMMKRSFSEKDSQKKQAEYKERVTRIKLELQEFPTPKESGRDLQTFYR